MKDSCCLHGICERTFFFDQRHEVIAHLWLNMALYKIRLWRGHPFKTLRWVQGCLRVDGNMFSGFYRSWLLFVKKVYI